MKFIMNEKTSKQKVDVSREERARMTKLTEEVTVRVQEMALNFRRMRHYQPQFFSDIGNLGFFVPASQHPQKVFNYFGVGK